MIFDYALYVIGCFSYMSLDLAMNETNQDKKRTNSEGIGKL